MMLPCSISPWQKKSKISASRKLQLKVSTGGTGKEQARAQGAELESGWGFRGRWAGVGGIWPLGAWLYRGVLLRVGRGLGKVETKLEGLEGQTGFPTPGLYPDAPGYASLPPLRRPCCCRLQSRSWSERRRSGAERRGAL